MPARLNWISTVFISHVQVDFTVSRLAQSAPTVSLVARRVVRVSETVVLSGSIQDPCAAIGTVGYVASWSSADWSGIGDIGVNSPRLVIPAYTLQTGEPHCTCQLSRDSFRFTVQSPPHCSSSDGSEWCYHRHCCRRWLRRHTSGGCGVGSCAVDCRRQHNHDRAG